MAKNDIDIRTHEEFNEALERVDKVVMKKYISEIDKRPVFSPSYDVTFSAREENTENPVCLVGTNIMLSKLTRVVFDKDENILDKLATVYSATSLYESASLVMLLKSDGIGIDVYLGTVCKKSDDPFVPQKQISALIRNMEANFPGSKLEEISDLNERIQVVQSIFENNVCVSAVSGIASLKNDNDTDNSTYVQGLEKLADSLKGKSCTVMIIADPVADLVKEEIRAGYEEIYSSLKPFEKSEYTLNKNSGKTITDSIIKGVTDTTNESLAKTNTHTLTNGTNSSHTVGGSIGINASVSGTAGLQVTPFGIGATTSLAATVGTSVSADYHYMKGYHEDKSDSEGKTKTTGTSKALSEQNSIANAASTNDGEGLQLSYENRSVKSILEKIDLKIKRIEKCEDYGMYDCGVYFLSDDYTTCLSVASTYKSIIQGQHSSVESSHISIWDEEESKRLIPYLSTFNHPIFDIADVKDEHSSVSVSTLVSGKELAIYMGLPKKSISGIPVIQCASFGRNILYTEEKIGGKKIDFGFIYHMHNDEKQKVMLDKHSFTSHVFVTGSTGSGKSNAIYQLLNNVCFELSPDSINPHFMVIEPAKGEYKDIFGGKADVKVYGTNPKIGRLLRINPFSFPEEIHVLEHIDRLIEIFNVCWPMYAAMPAVLKEAIERAYELVGWNLTLSTCENMIDGKNIFPNFMDVLKQVNQVIVQSKYSSDSKGDYIGALSMRISSLINGINGQILTDNELTEKELFDNNVIIDLSRIGSTETKSLLMAMLIMKLQEYRMALKNGNNKELSHVTVLEEAHNLLKRTNTEQSTESSNMIGKSVEMLANAIAEMRTYGEGFIIVDQSPGLMDMSVIRNTNTKIIFRLPDKEDRELVGKAANLNNDQIIELAKLKTGVCAVYQNEWIEPVLCHVRKWDEKKNKKIADEYEELSDSQYIKQEIIKLALMPPSKIKIEKLNIDIKKLMRAKVSSELKIRLVKLLKEKDVEKYRRLRKKIIYEVFDASYILEKNICYRNDIKEWYEIMQEELVPQLMLFEKDERDKILASLILEKSENKKEYLELLNNFLLFIENERRFS